MDRVLHCDVCFNTFDDSNKASAGVLPVDPNTNQVRLVCQDC